MRFIHPYRARRRFSRALDAQFPSHRRNAFGAERREADKYWLRTVRACLKAEEAYGPQVVYRLRYTALVENPKSTLRSLLDFLGEPYSAKCLEPL